MTHNRTENGTVVIPDIFDWAASFPPCEHPKRVEKYVPLDAGRDAIVEVCTVCDDEQQTARVRIRL